MRNTLFFPLCLALALFGADDPWAKVKELKSGTELRVYKKGSAAAADVKYGDLTEENLVVINKNEETAIARDADRPHRGPADRASPASPRKARPRPPIPRAIRRP